MPKKQNNNAKKTKQTVAPKGAQLARPKQPRPNRGVQIGDDWLRLLADPCAAQLARPCYSGMDGGYLLRTTDYYTMAYTTSGGSAGAATRGSCIFQWQPFNASSTSGIAFAAGISNNVGYGVALDGVSNFITTSTAVKKFRPVASCVKWIPNGPISGRAGTVDVTYAPGSIINNGASPSATTIRRTCMNGASNGQIQHEVKWLPTIVDEQWTNVAVVDNTGAGSCVLALCDIDCVFTSATSAVFNGQFEITTVWEWTPSSAAGTESLVKPSGVTTQQVLSRISDVGSFLYGMATSAPARQMIGGIMSSTYQSNRQIMY